MKMTSCSASNNENCSGGIDTKSMIENLISSKEKQNKSLEEISNLEWKKRKRSLIKEIRRKIFENIKFLLPIIGGRKFSLKILKWRPYPKNQKCWDIVLGWKIADNLFMECKSNSDHRWFVSENEQGSIECLVLNQKQETISHIKLWFADNKTANLEKFKAWLLENKNNLGEFTKDPRPNFVFYKKKEKKIKENKTKSSLKSKTEKKVYPKQIDKDEEIQRLKQQVKAAEYEASLERGAKINAENSARYEVYAKNHEEYKDNRRREVLSELSESYGWSDYPSDHDKNVLERLNSI